jgi:hypothetical protein
MGRASRPLGTGRRQAGRASPDGRDFVNLIERSWPSILVGQDHAGQSDDAWLGWEDAQARIADHKRGKSADPTPPQTRSAITSLAPSGSNSAGRVSASQASRTGRRASHPECRKPLPCSCPLLFELRQPEPCRKTPVCQQRVGATTGGTLAHTCFHVRRITAAGVLTRPSFYPRDHRPWTLNAALAALAT